MTVVVSLAIGSIRLGGNRLRRESQQLVQMIQAAYFQSLKQAKVFRIQILDGGQKIQVLRYVLPEPAPSKEDEEAYREWEKRQEEKQKALRDLSRDERRALTQVDRGDFELVRERELPEGVRVSKFLHRNPGAADSFLIYPTGEMQAVLIILEDEDGDSFSLKTNAITGRVEATKGLISEEEWNQKPKTE